nr:histidine kinase [uncultured Butyrivibrio sp.]
MAYVNTYIQLYTAIILAILLGSNLYFAHSTREKSVNTYYTMLLFGVLMLLSGGIDNYLLLPISKDRPLLESIMSGISDLSYFMVIGLFAVYLDQYGQGADYRVSYGACVAFWVSAITGAFWFVSEFTGIIYTQSADELTMGPLYYFGQIGGYVTTLITIIILIKRAKTFNKREVLAFIAFLGGPLIGSLFKGVLKYVTLMPLMVALSLIIIQVFVQGAREMYYRQQMLEMSTLRTDLLMSRMKPHFIYNVLNTIYALCDNSDKNEAKRAISLFSQYLRTNLVDLDSHKLISFEEELSHIENYLEIEKIRFGSKLEIKYDIREKEFLIPPLSVQTIVENAVRHGIEKKADGGTLEIHSFRDDASITIVIKDTGVGFDDDKITVKEKQSTKRKHVGIYSSYYRIEKLCGGHLSYNSKKNEGTTATIIIPLEGTIK